jgi:hypothetical protein
MSDGYGCAEGSRRACLDIRHPAAEVLTLREPAVAREALGYHGKLECSRSGQSGGRVNLGPPPATSRMGGMAAGATCPV